MALGASLPYTPPRSAGAGPGSPAPGYNGLPDRPGQRSSGSSASEYSGGPLNRGSTPTSPAPRSYGYDNVSPNSGYRDSYQRTPTYGQYAYPGFDSAYSYYSGMNAPAMAQLGVSDAGLGLQAAQYNAQFGAAQRYAGQDYGFGQRQYDLGMLGLQGQRDDAGTQLGFGNRRLDNQGFDAQAQYGFDNRRLDVREGAANRQIDYFGTLMGWNTEDLGTRKNFIDRFQGLAEDSAARQQGYVGQRKGFNQRGYDLDVGNIEQNTDTDLRRQRNEAAAAGAGTSSGNRADVADIYGTEGFQLGKAKLSFDDVLAGLNNESAGIREQLANQLLGFDQDRSELDMGYRRDQLGLGNQIAGERDNLANIGIDRDQNRYGLDSTMRDIGLSREELGANYNSTMRDLDIRGGELGLTRDQMAASIQRQLENASLDRFFGVADVMNALNSNDIQRQQLAEQIVRQATANAGAFANLPTARPRVRGAVGGG